jgi:hypothetical protein
MGQIYMQPQLASSPWAPPSCQPITSSTTKSGYFEKKGENAGFGNFIFKYPTFSFIYEQFSMGTDFSYSHIYAVPQNYFVLDNEFCSNDYLDFSPRNALCAADDVLACFDTQTFGIEIFHLVYTSQCVVCCWTSIISRLRSQSLVHYKP